MRLGCDECSGGVGLGVCVDFREDSGCVAIIQKRIQALY
jgi:hypothetical protein